ncbi:MAG: alpha/beta hydrolase-fold protein [Emcibacteraceae bacterium]|nr:alpha/beta hydrolase-fold protein [Emcibacteraceae bacterium]
MKLLAAIIFIVLSFSSAYADGKLSENIRITSDVLGYDLQYRVYTPQGMSESDQLSTIYVTDGPGYISSGKMIKVMDELISSGKMHPIIAIFIDSRNPDDLRENRRNYQLLCNAEYTRFFVSELLPAIDQNYPTSDNREDRVIQGVSFGGLNAACFGLMAYNHFGGISMHSPANSKFLKMLRTEYLNIDRLPLKMFLSFGNNEDNRKAGLKFKEALVEKEYDLKYMQNNKGHNWNNWRPMMDDTLLTYFAK